MANDKETIQRLCRKKKRKMSICLLWSVTLLVQPFCHIIPTRHKFLSSTTKVKGSHGNYELIHSFWPKYILDLQL